MDLTSNDFDHDILIEQKPITNLTEQNPKDLNLVASVSVTLTAPEWNLLMDILKTHLMNEKVKEFERTVYSCIKITNRTSERISELAEYIKNGINLWNKFSAAGEFEMKRIAEVRREIQLEEAKTEALAHLSKSVEPLMNKETTNLMEEN